MPDVEHSSITKADSHPPADHASEHTDGTDDIQNATGSQKGLATAAQITKLNGIETAADATPDATTSVKGKIEIATQGEVDTGTDTTRAVTPDTLSNYSGLGGGGGWTAVDASETAKGIAELATQSETNTGTDDARIVTPLKLASRTATETRAGVLEIATQGETDTGTDDTRAVTPLKLAEYSGLGGGSGVAVEEDGSEEGTGIDRFDFTTGLNVSVSGSQATISADGGGGGGSRTLVTLGSDVTNSTTTFADVTGLTLAVTSGTLYHFHFDILWTVPNTSVAALFTVNGPAFTYLAYSAFAYSTTTGISQRHSNAYGDTTGQSSSLATHSRSWVEGIIEPSSSGTLALQMKSTTAAQTATAKEGSSLEWW